MIRHYLLVALRHLRRQKGYAALNVAGLALGLACSFLIGLWVHDELRFDRFHVDGDRLFRVMQHTTFSDGQVDTGVAVPKPLAEVFERDYPEVEHAVLATWPQELVLADGQRATREEGYHAGPAFFEVFSFPLLVGDRRTVLADPDAAAISETLAEKLFGPGWQAAGVVGRTVRVVGYEKDFRVTGVFADVPEASSLQFDLVLPMADFNARNEWVEHWGNFGVQLFVQLAEGADAAAFARKVRGLINANHSLANAAVFLQPFADQNLYGDFRDGRLVGGRIEYVRVLSVVAVVILLLACINFMNLATARAAVRAKEVGVRKAIGAARRALVGQFLGEAVLVSVFAAVVSLLLVAAALPAFNALTGKALAFGSLGARSLGLLFGVALVTGLFAGSYPALYLSAFGAAGVLRGHVQGRGGAGLRKGLVVFQFAASILLLIGTIAVHRQVGYIQTKHLGLDRENVVAMTLEGGARERYDAFRQELLRQPGVARVTTADQNPLEVGSSTTDPTWDGKPDDSQINFYVIRAGYDFVETMGMELVAGRALSPAFGADSVNYVINEAAAEAMGMTDPVGKRLAFWDREGQIVGVMRDFHMASLYTPIEPTIISFVPSQDRLFVRVEPGRTAEALAGLRAVHDRFNPGYPFEYEFLDEAFARMYESERRIGALANAFAGLAVVIACLGLFGLAAFTAERRTKEVGIRKALGASVASLVALLSKDFVVLVAVAFAVAAPVGYLAMEQWLGGFAYRVTLGPWALVLAGAGALAVAFAAVGYHAFRAASSDPVKALRYE
jgi:predicted permease